MKVWSFHVAPKILLNNYGMYFYLVDQLRKRTLKRHNLGNVLKVVESAERNFWREFFEGDLLNRFA